MFWIFFCVVLYNRSMVYGRLFFCIVCSKVFILFWDNLWEFFVVLGSSVWVDCWKGGGVVSEGSRFCRVIYG